MDSINQCERADLVRQFNRAAKIVHRSQRITTGAERNHLCLLRDQPLEIVPIQLARFRIHLRDSQRDAAFDLERLPGSDVRVMLQFGDHDFVAGS